MASDDREPENAATFLYLTRFPVVGQMCKHRERRYREKPTGPPLLKCAPCVLPAHAIEVRKEKLLQVVFPDQLVFDATDKV